METKPSIDLFLINKFQKISDWSQDWFGIDCFGIARFFRNAVIVAYAARTFFTFMVKTDGWAIIGIFNSLLITLYVSFMLRYAERSVRNNPVFSNPLVIRFALFRTLWQFITIMALMMFPVAIFGVTQPFQNNEDMYKKWTTFAISFSDILIFLTLHFGSCTPKPHKPSKVRKLIEKAKESISRLRSPVLKPAYISG